MANRQLEVELARLKNEAAAVTQLREDIAAANAKLNIRGRLLEEAKKWVTADIKREIEGELKVIRTRVCQSIVSVIILIVVTGCVAIANRTCRSPVNFVRDVYSADGKTIEYDLDSSKQYRSVRIEFFAKRGMTLRSNTKVVLSGTTGTVHIPDDVFIAPAQRWFNFVAEDQDGCIIWGLVNEVPIQRKGNIIGIDIPTPGEGHAFVIK